MVAPRPPLLTPPVCPAEPLPGEALQGYGERRKAAPSLTGAPEQVLGAGSSQKGGRRFPRHQPADSPCRTSQHRRGPGRAQRRGTPRGGPGRPGRVPSLNAAPRKGKAPGSASRCRRPPTSTSSSSASSFLSPSSLLSAAAMSPGNAALLPPPPRPPLSFSAYHVGPAPPSWGATGPASRPRRFSSLPPPSGGWKRRQRQRRPRPRPRAAARASHLPAGGGSEARASAAVERWDVRSPPQAAGAGRGGEAGVRRGRGARRLAGPWGRG